jgi:hypothetical protein
MKATVEFTLERNDVEFDVTVTGDVTFSRKGSRRGWPENWTPDEPGEVDITSVKNAAGEDIELTDKEEGTLKERLTDAACEEAEEDCDDDPANDYDRAEHGRFGRAYFED